MLPKSHIFSQISNPTIQSNTPFTCPTRAVPIYMPIPFPVPMPMAPKPPPMPHPHQHTNNLYESGDGGGGGGGGVGEIKKIYILQPMGRLGHSQSTKGGHHNQHHLNPAPSPIQNYKQVNGQGDPATADDDPPPPPPPANHIPRHQHNIDQYLANGGFRTQESLKILPIVVIPPIAPMAPIQLSSSRNHEDGGYQSAKRARHHNSAYNEHRTFASYGASSGPSSTWRVRGYGQLKARPADSDVGFDDYDSGSTNWRPMTRRSHNQHASNNHYHSKNRRSRAHRVSSIRDIMEQQNNNNNQHSLFDDEPTAEISRDHYDGPLRYRHRQRPNNDHDSSAASSSINEQEMIGPEFGASAPDNNELARFTPSSFSINGPRGHSLISNRHHAHYHGQLGGATDAAIDGQQSLEALDLTSLDSLAATARSAKRIDHRHQSSFLAPADHEASLLDQLLEDDQWRYDSIKSVQHADPSSTINPNTNITQIPINPDANSNLMNLHQIASSFTNTLRNQTTTS